MIRMHFHEGRSVGQQRTVHVRHRLRRHQLRGAFANIAAGLRRHQAHLAHRTRRQHAAADPGSWPRAASVPQVPAPASPQVPPLVGRTIAAIDEEPAAPAGQESERGSANRRPYPHMPLTPPDHHHVSQPASFKRQELLERSKRHDALFDEVD